MESKIRTGLCLIGTDFPEPPGKDEHTINGNDEGHEAESNADEDLPDGEGDDGIRPSKRAHSPSVEATSAKRVRIGGFKFKTIAEQTKQGILGAADEHLYALREQGYACQYVADRLKDEGLGEWTAKTVDSHYHKIRQEREKMEEDRLDDELSDWHEGEDEILSESYNAVEQKFQLQVQKLLDKKWKEVSVALAQQIGKKKYTSKACMERFHGLEDGTALIPIELDQDPEGRAIMREARIAENKRIRAEAEEAERQAEWEKDSGARERKQYNEEKRRILHENTQANKAERAENKRLKEERRIGKQKERIAKEASLRWWKKNIEDKRQIKEDECRVYYYYTGKHLRRQQGKKKDDDDWDSDEEVYELDEMIKFDDSTDDDASAVTDEETISHPTKRIRKQPPRSNVNPLEVTKETLLNPRSIMTDDELEAKLHERGMPRRQPGEIHPQLVARLAAADADLPYVTLNSMLDTFFQSKKGDKNVKARRLQEAEAAESAAGQNGTESTSLNFKKGYEGYTGKYAGLINEE